MAGQCIVDSLGQEIRDCNLQAVYGRHVLDWVVLWLMSPHFCLSRKGWMPAGGRHPILSSQQTGVDRER